MCLRRVLCWLIGSYVRFLFNVWMWIVNKGPKSRAQVLSLSHSVDGQGVMSTLSEQTVVQPTAKISIRLRIEGFKTLMELYRPGMGVWSKEVTSPQLSRAAWKMHTFPNGEYYLDLGDATFHVCLIGEKVTNEENIEAAIQLRLINAAGVTTATTDVFFFSSYAVGGIGVGAGRISRNDVTNSLHADGALLVHIDITLLLPPSRRSNTAVADPAEEALKAKRLDTFAKLRQTGQDSDCTLVVGDTSFQVHRCVLVASSPAFGPMFAEGSAYKEAREGEVHIQDSTPEAVALMLDYMYTGELDWRRYTTGGDGQFSLQVELLHLADKYALHELKTLVGAKLAARISTIPHFVDMAQLAEACSCHPLMKACIHYLINNHAKVMSSAEWKELKVKGGKLALDLLEMGMNGGGEEGEIAVF